MTSPPPTSSSRHITGVIVRRSCMGKRLSFADIRCSSNSDLGQDDEEEVKNTNNNNTGDENGIGDDASAIAPAVVVKIAFKCLPDSAWKDEESPTPFPVKTSHLPYGAVVCVELLDYDDNNNDSDSDNVVYDVITWQILQDPKQTAESIATVGGRDNQKQQQQVGGGGLSYSTYLRERGNQFSKHTIKGQKISQQYCNQKMKNKTEGEGGGGSNRSTINNNNNSMKRPRMTHQQQQQKQQQQQQQPTAHSITVLNNAINDDLAEANGGHGDKVVKAMRARLFALWLLETFGSESLRGRRGDATAGTAGCGGVLDVAGGKGHLSIELAATGKIPCVMIDPMIRKKHCRGGGDNTTNFPVKRDAKRIRKAGGPLPRHLPTFFNQTTFLEQYGKKKNDEEEDVVSTSTTTTPTPTIDINGTIAAGDLQQHNGSDNNDNNLTNDETNADDDSYLIENCTTLIGLHPDQTTQDILEIALRFHKSVAIVPCCVFPSFFPFRQLKDGTMVNTYEQFCQYLCEKDPTLQRAILPFAGRNVVIYRKVV